MCSAVSREAHRSIRVQVGYAHGWLLLFGRAKETGRRFVTPNGGGVCFLGRQRDGAQVGYADGGLLLLGREVQAGDADGGLLFVGLPFSDISGRAKRWGVGWLRAGGAFFWGGGVQIGGLSVLGGQRRDGAQVGCRWGVALLGGGGGAGWLRGLGASLFGRAKR